MFFFNRNRFGFKDIGLKSDIHCHILPAVDDGSRSTGASIAILKDLSALGVERFVLTPHVSEGVYPNTSTALKCSFDAFDKAVRQEMGDAVQLHLAAEYMIDDAFEDRKDLLLYPDGSVLVEMSYHARSANLQETVFNLVQDGFNPILAHPERYEFYFSDSGKVRSLREIEKLVAMGCRLQLNVQSLTGCYGRGSLDNLCYMLDHNLYSFIATDIHSQRQAARFENFRISPARFEKVRALAHSNERLFKNI